MAVALASVGFMVAFVLAGAALLGGLHRLLRARQIHARSATALRELEPRGGRHRFHVRLFEVMALSSAGTAGLGALLLFAAAPGADPTLPVVGGGALLVAVWWAWRRGTLRAVEAEPSATTTAEVGRG